MSTEGISSQDRFEAWRHAMCKMVHNVQVEPTVGLFSASITARRHGDVSCARFGCTSHELSGRRERLSDAGAGGYLLGYQLEGVAHVEQGNMHVVLQPGSIAVIDGRRSMRVSFQQDVRVLVAKLPVRIVEHRLPFLARTHALALTPHSGLSTLLVNYLNELSSASSVVQASDFDLIAENVSNLLSILSGRGVTSLSQSSGLLKDELVRLLRQEACNPELSLQCVASRLAVSERQVQRMLQELKTSFTEFVREERLQVADRHLRRMEKVSISEIAHLSGFNDISHFNYQFKRRFGVTPTDRRIQNKSE